MKRNEDVSFKDVPDPLKVKLLSETNQKLFSKIEAEVFENNSLYDEIEHYRKINSDLRAQYSKMQSELNKTQAKLERANELNAALGNKLGAALNRPLTEEESKYVVPRSQFKALERRHTRLFISHRTMSKRFRQKWAQQMNRTYFMDLFLIELKLYKPFIQYLKDNMDIINGDEISREVQQHLYARKVLENS